MNTPMSTISISEEFPRVTVLNFHSHSLKSQLESVLTEDSQLIMKTHSDKPLSAAYQRFEQIIAQTISLTKMLTDYDDSTY